jgi:hypothetical protein
LAKTANAVIFVVGYNRDDEGEFINNPDEEVDALGIGLSIVINPFEFVAMGGFIGFGYY